MLGSGLAQALRRGLGLSAEHEDRVRGFGTRVRLYPQAPALTGFGEPEVVWLSPAAGTIGPGPSDDRIYVVDPLDKPQPYAAPYLPPYFGDTYPPAEPGLDGHFDHFALDSRHFAATHLYGSVRRVLDIFESYAGRRIAWSFEPDLPRLEIVPLIDWDNAQSGYGFMEFGFADDERGERHPFALNFDVVGHEVGHALVFSLVGTPFGPPTLDYMAFHESASDLAALLSTMHFDSILERLLHLTRGNIYTVNELNRIGELSDVRQIRLACNDRRMSDVTGEIHDRSRPLTGAFFDVLALFYLERLHEQGLIRRDLRDAARDMEFAARNFEAVQAAFNRAYANRHLQFKGALEAARDTLGTRLVETWQALSPETLSFTDVAETFRRLDPMATPPDQVEELQEIFSWREIL